MVTDSFRQWVRVNADSPEPLAAPPYLASAVHPVLLVTGQRSWWFTSEQQWVRLTDMEPAHRRALLAVLRRYAELWQTEHALDADTPVGSVPGPPDEWIEAQPLTIALAALVAADEAEAASPA